MPNKNTLYVDGKTFLNMPIVDTSITLEIVDIADFDAVKAKLIKLYGITAQATADGKKTTLGDINAAHAVSVAAQTDFKKSRYNAADALRVTARLTQEDGGCPWDKAQTHDSIRINMIEEAYEAVDAIDKKDVENMREEFGDVFLQAILHSDISKRSGEFDFDDVCDELCKKLIGRHTFIFGEDSAANPDEALTLWEKAKGVEKHYDSVKNQLSRLPDNFPALLLCQKTHKKLKKSGAVSDAAVELNKALADKDYTRVIAASVALLSDDGKDAEVELNKFVKSVIEGL